ncbi:MAG: aldehyde-activating protein [Pseudomonadota bacterium]
MNRYRARCHCDALGYTYLTAIDPTAWSVRSCQCEFCRGHGARCTSDPDGAVCFEFSDENALRRYRFGLRTADFLVCRRCGVYLAAVIQDGDKAFATVNLNALISDVPGVPPTEPAVYDGENTEGRIERRYRRWTPVRDQI